jgi:hypothetical protein
MIALSDAFRDLRAAHAPASPGVRQPGDHFPGLIRSGSRSVSGMSSCR